MEYRNSGNATHYGKGVAIGVDGNNGLELQGSSLAVISDSAAANLTIVAKGTGNVQIGDSSQTVSLAGSTTQFKLVCGESSYRPPALSSFAQDYSTFAAAGISTGDLILTVDFRGTLSTVYIVGTPTPSSANEIRVSLGNLHNSSVSGSSGRVRWAYIDRT